MNVPSAMIAESSAPFGSLLRALRLESALTQMELAERAGMSVRAVAALECGERRAPYRETVSALVQALETSSADAERLAAAATRGRGRPNNDARATTLGNVPVALTTFVGRDALLERAEAMLSVTQCIVVTGRAGVGKTRLASVLADRLARRFSGGAWLIDLSSAASAEAVVTKTASVVARTISRTADASTLAREIGDRAMLLVLDNCERVAAACALLIAAIRSTCPNVSIVATSIAAIGLNGEAVVRVDPLALPDASGIVTMDDLRSFASAELFVERCERYGYRFQPGNETVRLIISICRRLEGLPLAIELAASRAASLGLANLDATIARWFSASAGAFVDGPDRHRSLFAAIDWSHDLLDDAERIVFRRLSIFAGGFDLAAAAAVCSAPPLDRGSVSEIVLSLADKSLLTMDVRGGIRRWSLFDSTRSYAAAKLRDAAEVELLQRAHAAYYAAYFGSGIERFFSASTAGWLRSIHADEENVEAAIAWGLSELGEPLVAARLVGSLLTYWSQTGRVREARAMAEILLPKVDENSEPGCAAALLVILAISLNGNDAVLASRRAVELYERCADPLGGAVARTALAYSLTRVGHDSEAQTEIDRAALTSDATGRPLVETSPRLAAWIHRRRGEAYAQAGRWRDAHGEHSAAVQLSLQIDDGFAVRNFTIGLAEASFGLGDVRGAVERLERLLRDSRSPLDRYVECGILANLAAYQIVDGEIDAAAEYVRGALAINYGDEYLSACVLQHAATVCALRSKPNDASRLLGYVDNYRRATAFARQFTEEAANNVLISSLEAQLTREKIDALSREGAHLSERDALELARGLLE